MAKHELIFKSSHILQHSDDVECDSVRASSGHRTRMPTISSRGCCRAFIAFTLHRVLVHCATSVNNGLIVVLPIHSSVVHEAMKKAQSDCASNELYQEALGGIRYNSNDSTTYWTQAQQFYTWCGGVACMCF